MEVECVEVPGPLLTRLNFWASSGCLLKNPACYRMWQVHCGNSTKPLKLNERVDFVGYAGYSKN
jgi:hypothetical protein